VVNVDTPIVKCLIKAGSGKGPCSVDFIIGGWKSLDGGTVLQCDIINTEPE